MGATAASVLGSGKRSGTGQDPTPATVRRGSRLGVRAATWASDAGLSAVALSVTECGGLKPPAKEAVEGLSAPTRPPGPEMEEQRDAELAGDDDPVEVECKGEGLSLTQLDAANANCSELAEVVEVPRGDALVCQESPPRAPLSGGLVSQPLQGPHTASGTMPCSPAATSGGLHRLQAATSQAAAGESQWWRWHPRRM